MRQFLRIGGADIPGNLVDGRFVPDPGTYNITEQIDPHALGLAIDGQNRVVFRWCGPPGQPMFQQAPLENMRLHCKPVEKTGS